MSEQQNNIEERAMLPVGTLLQGGKYRIERYLSSGGFGNTYVATNTEFEEQVAIKEFFMRGISQRDENSVSVSVSNKTNLSQFSAQKEKFRKEARRLRKLRNNHIVVVHDLFEENGTAYYEMDLIKGESLSERMKHTGGQPLPETEVLSILDQVLDALSVVHAQGLYHLDLKPANIMVDQTGRALLIDFGASKQMSAGEGNSVSTSSALAFTPGYAPLEQTEQSIKSFGPWTDLYALGATLYKLLTGLTPPSASEILMMKGPLMFPTPVSAKTQQLIGWMMRPRLDERPQSVDAIKRFLAGKYASEETVIQDGPTPNPQPKPQPKPQPQPEPEPSSSKRVWWIAAACVALVAGAVVMIGLLLLKSPSDEPAVADTEMVLLLRTPIDSYLKSLKQNLDEKDAVTFNEHLRIVSELIDESLNENPRESVEMLEAIRDFLGKNGDAIKTNLGFSSETIQKTEELTKGTVQEYLTSRAKIYGITLTPDVFEEKQHKSEQRIW
jgi:serine/threonine protein kinase